MSVIAWNDQGAYEMWGLFKRNINQDEVNALKFIGVKDVGAVPALLALRTDVPRVRLAGS